VPCGKPAALIAGRQRSLNPVRRTGWPASFVKIRPSAPASKVARCAASASATTWGSGTVRADAAAARYGTTDGEPVRFRAMWLGTTEACEYLDIRLRTLYRRIDLGELPAYRMGRVIRVRQSDLDDYIESCRIEPSELGHLYPDSGHVDEDVDDLDEEILEDE
jgi:excisionase family DNA binding protein